MRWLRRRRAKPGALRQSDEFDTEHLKQFAASRRGVEGFVEPPTTVSETTLLLVAVDGEWTRRRVKDAKWAHEFANDLGIPTYDAAVVGYPSRMREWNRRQRVKYRDIPDDLSGL
jgi:hypothetical protein